jgi:hypothetical protein
VSADLTDKQREALAAVELHGSKTKAAAALGIDRKVLRVRLASAERKMSLDPAIHASMVAVGTDMVPALAWAKTKSEDGTSYSVLLKPPAAETVDTAQRIREALEGLEPAPAVVAPQYADDALCTVVPLADCHVGMMAWGVETGEDYDTKIATARIRDWVGRVIDASPASGTAIILDVGDLTHADDQTNQTPKSKHGLDVDTRHFRTLDVTIAALAYSVDYALRKHRRVVVRILPGNHNPAAYLAVMFALAERYREEPRVEVQKVPGEFFLFEFGKVMIAAHHGDKAKADRIVHFLADQYAEAWGRTKHRFLFTGHLHHHKAQDIGGVTHEQLRALTARDAYAVSHAYTARAQLQAITFHRDFGEIQRVKVGA